MISGRIAENAAPSGKHSWLSGGSAFSAQPIDSLACAALCYLALPNLIFFAGWFKAPVALALSGMACLLIYRATKGNFRWRDDKSSAALAAVVLTGIVWSAMGGAGHFFHPPADWTVRDAVAGDLALADWPVSYAVRDGAHFVLRSAIGFFLPAALLTKLFGVGVLDWALYAWTALGTVIFLLLVPLPSRFGGLLVACLAAIVFFGGMDLFGVIAMSGMLPVFPIRMEWWSIFSYTSISGQLFWAPNHALAIWIITALFFRHWKHPDFAPYALALLPLSIVWTPFAVAGILPFALLALADRAIRDERLPIEFPYVIVALLLCLPVLRFLSIGFEAIHSDSSLGHLATKRSDLDAEGATAIAIEWGRHYAAFVLFEFGLLALALAKYLGHSRGMFAISVVVLAILPFFVVGPSNDTLLRLSTTPLVILMLLCLQVIAAGSPSRPWILWLALIFAAPTGFTEMYRNVTWQQVPADYRKNLPEVLHGDMPAHYVGKLEAVDVRWLLRDPVVTASGKTRRLE